MGKYKICSQESQHYHFRHLKISFSVSRYICCDGIANPPPIHFSDVSQSGINDSFLQGWMILCCGRLSCALQNVQQNPCPLFTRCQQKSTVTTKTISRCCQKPPGRQNDFWLRTTALNQDSPLINSQTLCFILLPFPLLLFPSSFSLQTPIIVSSSSLAIILRKNRSLLYSRNVTCEAIISY